VDFPWNVSRAGYEWAPRYDIQYSPVALCTLDHNGSKEYQPLRDEPSLYLRFAELKVDNDAYLAFANEFGHLTAGVTVINEAGYSIEGEYADKLRHPIVRPDDGEWLLQTAQEADDPPLETPAEWTKSVLKMKEVIRKWKRATSRSSKIAQSEYGKTIIANLWHRVIPCYDDSGALAYLPINLLGAMWLQLAYAVGRGGAPRQCPTCSDWFVVSNSSSGHGRRTRSDKKFCSDECRMKAAYGNKSKKRPARQHVRVGSR
jgi:hypothetical protein